MTVFQRSKKGINRYMWLKFDIYAFYPNLMSEIVCSCMIGIMEYLNSIFHKILYSNPNM